MPSEPQTAKLSHALRDALEAYGFLKIPLEMGLVNHAALARRLKPMLEKQTGARLSVEAIGMALHRHAGAVRPGHPGPLRIVAECKLHLLADMAAAHYPYSRKLEENVAKAKAAIERQGGALYVVERTNEMSFVTETRYLPQIHAIAGATKPLNLSRHAALVTVQYPPEGLQTSGVLNHMVQALNHADINVLGVFSSYSKVSFLVAENDAPEAYETLQRAIAVARTMQ